MDKIFMDKYIAWTKKSFMGHIIWKIVFQCKEEKIEIKSYEFRGMSRIQCIKSQMTVAIGELWMKQEEF